MILRIYLSGHTWAVSSGSLLRGFCLLRGLAGGITSRAESLGEPATYYNIGANP